MAILITAPLGTGKTLKTIELIFEYLNQGRPVYTNIVGLKIPGVFSVNSNINNPLDWRDLPNEAVLFIDEAHEHPALSERDLLKNLTIQHYEDELKRLENLEDVTETHRKSLISKCTSEYAKALKRKKEEIMDIGLSMSMHRHFGQEIIFITQNPTKLNKDALSNVTIHYVMRRKFGMEAATVWTFGEAMTTWGKSVAEGALNKEIWRFPKHLYKFYVSSEKHNVKKYFPKKYYAYACIPLLIFGLGYSKAKETGFFGLVPKDETAAMQPENQVIQIKEGDSRPQSEIIEEAKAKELGMTVEQYRAMNQPQPLQNLDFECRKAVNVERAECVQWMSNLGQQVQTASYDPNDPYGFHPPVQVQIHDYPRLSGCAKFGDKYYAFDQQGNKMPNIKQNDCKRWMAGEKPFNYSQQPQQAMNYAPSTQADNTQPREPTVYEIAQMQEAKSQGLI